MVSMNSLAATVTSEFPSQSAGCGPLTKIAAVSDASCQSERDTGGGPSDRAWSLSKHLPRTCTGSARGSFIASTSSTLSGRDCAARDVDAAGVGPTGGEGASEVDVGPPVEGLVEGPSPPSWCRVWHARLATAHTTATKLDLIITAVRSFAARASRAATSAAVVSTRVGFRACPPTPLSLRRCPRPVRDSPRPSSFATSRRP